MMVGCRTTWLRTTGLERIVRRESDESWTDVGRTKVIAMAALSLAMLQQRWRCNSQRYCCYGSAVAATLLLLLVRRCCFNVAVGACYGAAAATLLL
ncbi:unnamed protein product [Sphagnum troendelagicum]